MISKDQFATNQSECPVVIFDGRAWPFTQRGGTIKGSQAGQGYLLPPNLKVSHEEGRNCGIRGLAPLAIPAIPT